MNDIPIKINVGNVRLSQVSAIDLIRAIDFEITRQRSLIERNIPILEETRTWDKEREITRTCVNYQQG